MSLSTAGFYRNLAFGVQDAVVTTMGVLVGTAAGKGVDPFRAGIVSVVASAFSMAIGSYQSERSAELANATDEADIKRTELSGGAMVMFISYLVTGLILVAPWRLRWFHGNGALIASVIAAALLLGGSAAYVSQGLETEHIVTNVAEMLSLALVAVLGSYFLSRLY